MEIKAILSRRESLLSQFKHELNSYDNAIDSSLFLSILENNKINVKDAVFLSILNVTSGNTSNLIDFDNFLSFLEKNSDLWTPSESEEKRCSTQESVSADVQPKETGSRIEIPISLKEKTKFLFYSLYHAALRHSFSQFCAAFTILHPKLNNEGSKSLGDLKPISCKEDVFLHDYYSAPQEFELRGIQTSQNYQQHLGLLNESYQTLSDSRNFQYNLPKIPNPTANNSRVNVSLLSTYSEQQHEDIKTLKKKHRSENRLFNPSERAQTSQAMLFTEGDSNPPQNPHEINDISKINFRSPHENDTFNDLLGNIHANDFMKLEYNYTKEGCSLYPQSQHYENVSDANGSSLENTSNRLDETGELRFNAQMDYAVMKLYAERVLRKNLQAQAERLQQTNINLTIEKTAAIYERDTISKKYNRLRYRNFAVSLQKILKRHLKNILQMTLNHRLGDFAQHSQRKLILERLLIKFKSQLLQHFLKWKDNVLMSQPLSDHRQLEINPDSIFDYSARSISPRGMPVFSNRGIAYSNQKVSLSLSKYGSAVIRCFIMAIEKGVNRQLYSSMSLLKEQCSVPSSLQRTDALYSLLKTLETKFLQATAKGFNAIFNFAAIEKSTVLTQKRSQELKRRMKNDIYRSASHILVCISVTQQQKALFQAMSLWRKAVFAGREDEFINKVRQNSEQFHLLKQQYAKFAKTYDMLNSKYKNVMNKAGGDRGLFGDTMNSSFELNRSLGTEPAAGHSLASQKARTMPQNLALKLKEGSIGNSSSPIPSEETPKLSCLNNSGKIRVKNLFDSQRQSEKTLESCYQASIASSGFEGSGPLANITNKSKTYTNLSLVKASGYSKDETAKKTPLPLASSSFIENSRENGIRQDKRFQDKFSAQTGEYMSEAFCQSQIKIDSQV